jgi:diaminohydroxyphosphoribosylaminopyrimidine deaminase/5-amino-6-(5-phosphoribosylamino)uracil reductase
MAILVGRRTVENDNPSLTVRDVDGRNPIRIVIDSQIRIQKESTVFNDAASTIVINQLRNEVSENVEYIKLDVIHPESILTALYEKDIQSVFIEGGAHTLQSFIDANLWDEACVIIGQQEFEAGTMAPTIEGNFITETHFGDTLKLYRNV